MFYPLTRIALTYSIFIIVLSAYPPSTSALPLSNIKPNNTAIKNEALLSFQHAMKDANERLQRFRQKKHAVALTQTSEDMNGNIFQQRFTPTSYSQNEIIGSWQTIKADEQFDESITVTDDILFESTSFDIDSVQLIHETQSTWVFRIANIINIDSDNDSAERELEKLDEAISENLLTDITIDRKLSKIKSIKIYAVSEFKPNWMVTIEKFELRLNFKEAWPNGPMIRHSMTRHMKGQYGWLISLDELVTTEFSDIKKVSLAE